MPEIPQHLAQVQFERTPFVLRLRDLVAEHFVCLSRLFELRSELALLDLGAVRGLLRECTDLDELPLRGLCPPASVPELLSKLFSLVLGALAMVTLAGELRPRLSEGLGKGIDVGREQRELGCEISFGHRPPCSSFGAISLPA